MRRPPACRQQVEAALNKLKDFHGQFQISSDGDRYLQKERYNFQISGLVEGINGRLENLKAACNREPDTLFRMGPGSRSFRENKEVQGQIVRLGEDAKQLQQNISDEVNEIKSDARHRYTLSFWVVGTTSVLGVLLMAGLMRFFYAWVFTRSAIWKPASAGWPRAISITASRSTAATRWRTWPTPSTT